MPLYCSNNKNRGSRTKPQRQRYMLTLYTNLMSFYHIQPFSDEATHTSMQDICSNQHMNCTLKNIHCVIFYMHLASEWMLNANPRYFGPQHCSNCAVWLAYNSATICIEIVLYWNVSNLNQYKKEKKFKHMWYKWNAYTPMKPHP